jgi:hypothetical protein
MNNVFISGWGGYQDMFEHIPKVTNFYTPFIHNDKYIEDAICAGGDVIVGWSTGAHILAKIIYRYIDRWKKVILVAPFSNFTNSFSEKALNIMIKNLKADFIGTMENFYSRCGFYGKVVLSLQDIVKLEKGLEFLKHSKVNKGCNSSKISILYGTEDKIVKRKEIDAILNLFENARFIELCQPHFIDEKVIVKYAGL